MPGPETDPETIEQALSRLEDMIVERLNAIHGDGQQTAIATHPVPAGQSAYQLPRQPLRSAETRQRIRDRIAEPPVTPEEIIGTLASHMRGDISQLLDESGRVDFKLIKQRRLGHLIKSITTTVNETSATEEKPTEAVKTIRVKLHSRLQAAAILARLAGMDPGSGDEG